jgi:hypothetical protein
MAVRERIGRVVYLGGLGDQPSSRHLRSRHETARLLAAEGPPLTYFRTIMVVGARSESYRTLRYLVQRLPGATGVARPLVVGLRTETVATDPSGAELFPVQPLPFDETLRRALAEEDNSPSTCSPPPTS